MKVEKLALEKTGSFASIFLDYLKGDEKLAPTHSFDPSIEGFEKALSYRKLSDKARNTLSEVLTEQYTTLTISDLTSNNITLLKDQKTFTVTTGHQLNIFTGPLFFVYKIAATINICSQLSNKFPEFNFVPVYWMASEDHDFEEIDHTFVDGEKYTWETDQLGAVGRFNTKGLEELANEIPGRTEIFKAAYSKSKNLADAVRDYVNELFGVTGLVVVDADHPRLKQEFVAIAKDDLMEHTAFEAVTSRSEYLIEQGYKPQLNPREINLFYLKDDLRARIEQEGDLFRIVDTDLVFSKDEILDELKAYPERFSPNVILRPVYQEVILPNLGYVGGPAELAYWLQYKEMFDVLKVDFPVLMPRTFGLYLDKNNQRKIATLGLDYANLFDQIDVLKKKYVHSHNGRLDLVNEREEIKKVYESLKVLATDIDPTLRQHIEAQLTKHQQCMDNIQSKFIKAEKRNMEDEMAMISAIKDYVFPGGTLQERKVNFLSINNPNLILNLLNLIDPFDLKMHIFLED